MNNLDQSLNYPTITGLKSLELDELTTTNLNSDRIDTEQIFYNRIEGKEIVVDDKLTLSANGVISVGGKTIPEPIHTIFVTKLVPPIPEFINIEFVEFPLIYKWLSVELVAPISPTLTSVLIAVNPPRLREIPFE